MQYTITDYRRKIVISIDGDEAFGKNQYPFIIKTLKNRATRDFHKLIKNIYKNFQ